MLKISRGVEHVPEAERDSESSKKIDLKNRRRFFSLGNVPTAATSVVPRTLGFTPEPKVAACVAIIWESIVRLNPAMSLQLDTYSSSSAGDLRAASKTLARAHAGTTCFLLVRASSFRVVFAAAHNSAKVSWYREGAIENGAWAHKGPPQSTREIDDEL